MDAEVIKAAATSPLGILALLILVLSGLATAFFNKASTSVKVGVFVLMLGAAVTFGAVVLRQPAPAVAQQDKEAPEPPPPAKPEPAGVLLPLSSERQIQPAELTQFTPAQLRIARNEIYARHGLIFKAPDLRAHFAQFAWYRPTEAQVALSPLEQQNIRTLQDEEKAR